MTADMPGLAVALSSVRHRFPGEITAAIDGLDLIVSGGEIVALVGPSGAGKSTLMTLLDGRLRGWKGGALVLGRTLSPDRSPSRHQRAETGFVFQEFALIERASVRQNVLNGRLGRSPMSTALFGRFTTEDHAAADAAMRDVGIDDLADRRVDRLSGGQRQRVAIARCLAQQPRLILADEPVSSLDPHNSISILRLLADAARTRAVTLLFSSHQPELATQVADRIVALKAGRVALDMPAARVTEAALTAVYGTADLSPQPLRLVG